MSDNIDDVFNDECDAINYSLISCQIKLIKKRMMWAVLTRATLMYTLHLKNHFESFFLSVLLCSAGISASPFSCMLSSSCAPWCFRSHVTLGLVGLEVSWCHIIHIFPVTVANKAFWVYLYPNQYPNDPRFLFCTHFGGIFVKWMCGKLIFLKCG